MAVYVDCAASGMVQQGSGIANHHTPDECH